jgi:uncharacterized protein
VEHSCFFINGKKNNKSIKIGIYAIGKYIKMNPKKEFDVDEALHKLKHYLPSQGPLKDFIHHNTLHAFQDLKFHEALEKASVIFGYKCYLSIDEYRQRFKKGEINIENLRATIRTKFGSENVELWEQRCLNDACEFDDETRIGALRGKWKQYYKFFPDKFNHPTLFRILGSYLDQGIAMRPFPMVHKGLMSSIREIERNTFISFFKSSRVKDLVLHTHCKIEHLLEILIGDEELFEQYLFDQQFAHPGWSGMASFLESNPEALLDKRSISLHDLIALELLMEIDDMDLKFPKGWQPLGMVIQEQPKKLFSEIQHSTFFQTQMLLQEALEWTYYDEVLNGMKSMTPEAHHWKRKEFQAMFCIDDRECSLRRYIEEVVPQSETFSTPGFFNVPFYFQPAESRYYTKVCPAPLTPVHIIKELNAKNKNTKDAHFNKNAHSLIGGWLLTQTLGFWSALKLFISIFRPSVTPTTAFAFHHMDKDSSLTIENKGPEHKVHGLQIGFTIDEMTDRVEGLLKSIGLIKDFAPFVYVVGHGASSVNNTHYAGYDCGACSGRPGSVNARVFAHMANDSQVRTRLLHRGIEILDETHFIGAMHDTTRDEIEFYDEHVLELSQLVVHKSHVPKFRKALALNAKERARRFVLMSNKGDASKVHEKVKLRSVSLFEPRPELNHATNALCIIGKREMTSGLFLDRRAFLNSYDAGVDPDGKYLLNILKAAAPVCGGINLEYYFSRVDNHRLGAGSKLPHNAIGLIGVANGADGDLRPGLPSQMIEVHDPLRLLMVVEHFPEVILNILNTSLETFEWFLNEWVHLIAIHPTTRELFRFVNGDFELYQPIAQLASGPLDVKEMIINSHENLHVTHLKKQYA